MSQRPNRKPKVALLYGGNSEEREVSIRSAKAVHRALTTLNYPVEKISVSKDLISRLKNARPDIAFIAMHGNSGEDGTIQALLDALKIPYTGSGVLASALAMNKTMSKRLFIENGIQTPSFVSARKESQNDIAEDIRSSCGYPAVVKPASQGSTIGLSIVKSAKELSKALKMAFVYDNEILIEQQVKGAEVTVGVLGNSNPVALPTLEIATKTKFYDYRTKYTAGLSNHIIPARIGKKQRELAKKMAVAAHKALGCRGFSRADFICPKGKDPFILEVNTVPGLTNLSLFPDAAKAKGISFKDLVSKLIDLALEEKSE
ncbi:MAG: D-alanine--D-alanine ligase [Actinobacteria bacterium]|nr:MAG: D-alanine--D-alanine ligase [Actinomycetota bacterium]